MLSIAKKRQKLGSRSAKFHRLDYTETMHELVRDTVFAPLCGTGTDREDHDDGDLAVAPAKPQLKKPPLYRVILLNDDYTPMEFVVQVLEQFFGMGREKATQVMLAVHTQGKGRMWNISAGYCRDEGIAGEPVCPRQRTSATV